MKIFSGPLSGVVARIPTQHKERDLQIEAVKFGARTDIVLHIVEAVKDEATGQTQEKSVARCTLSGTSAKLAARALLEAEDA